MDKIGISGGWNCIKEIKLKDISKSMKDGGVRSNFYKSGT